MNEILVAIITGAVSLIGTVITVLMANKSTIAALDKQSAVNNEKIEGQIAVIQQEIQTLSDRVDKHNNLVERTYSLEKRADVTDEKIKVANKRIEDLEDDAK